MTEGKRPQTRSGQARVEYRTVQQEVAEKLAAGYSKIIIFEELINSGRLTISYSAFCDYIRGEGVRLHSRRRKLKPKVIPRSGAVNPIRRAAKSEPFSIDHSLTMKDLIGPFAND